MTDDFEPTDAEATAIARAVRRLSGYGRDETAMWVIARTALRVLEAAHITQPEPDDPPLFAELAMPTWNQPSAAFPTVDRPLLDLLEMT